MSAHDDVPGTSPWFLKTPREVWLERENARLERELYAYKTFDRAIPAALRYTTLIEPEVMEVSAHPQQTLQLVVDWESERTDIGRHVIGRWRTGKDSFGYRYYISDPDLMSMVGGVSALAAYMHEKVINEIAGVEK